VQTILGITLYTGKHSVQTPGYSEVWRHVRALRLANGQMSSLKSV